MNSKSRRFFTLFLIFTLLLSSIGNVPVSATTTSDSSSSVTYDPANPYVLHFKEEGNTVWGYAQFSPFVPTLSYNNDTVNGYSIIFGLVDTYNNNTPFEKLYCMDMPVDTANATNYQRVNLSDSTYASAYANKLRGIVKNTYPNITIEKLRKQSGINDLSLGEAITGSQLAIWKTTHGDTVSITDFLSFTTTGHSTSSPIQKKLYAEKDSYDSGDAAYKASVEQRIESLYNYLLSLPEEAPTKIVASNASFVKKDTAPTVTKNDDGTYDVTVHTTVNVQLGSSDSLTLTAHMNNGTYCAGTSLQNGSQDYTLTIKNVPESLAYGTVTLAIDGVQTGGDVFLVDADGIRGTSQSMIGYLGQTLPVHAETKVEPDRVLTIHKTEKTESGNGAPLENISFEVYYVGSVDDYRNGSLGIGSKPTEADIRKYAVSTKLVATMTTDSSGNATLNLGTADGVYLVKELPNDAIQKPVSPFFVSLPDYSRCDEYGNPAYTITANPKNTISTEEVDIEKDVTFIGNKSDTFDVGEDHTWIIRTSIPKTLASGKSYVITDTLDGRLTFQSLDKIVVAPISIINSDNTASVATGDEILTLKENTDYTFVKEAAYDDNNKLDSERFTISLTKSGMQKVAATVGSNSGAYEIRTYFTAQINKNAQMGVNIENQAHIDYTNHINKTFSDTSDKPEVHTGGTRIVKVDATSSTTYLAGAVFEVYRDATPAEVNNNNFETLLINKEKHKVVQVSFYNTKNLSGDKTTSVTTGTDGIAYIYGIAYGDYYLVETKAPDGYNRLSDPISFVINASSHLESATETSGIIVKNTSGAELPETGGIGTALFTTSGIFLMLAAAFLLCKNRNVLDR